ncbi:polymorphic toxin-type HINT domain-containing protein [Streptomyces sp. RPT161]|uniref:polymorphic toxin-type HINT domain-containing protein n=1 Tax=Streptomyces sp. RPT161 TaxID=3015993 RepID=UPI0022B913F5|nr:polymorphic toxin-type HINT domain-containing protein [Streptomyces sp. RPT161]
MARRASGAIRALCLSLLPIALVAGLIGPTPVHAWADDQPTANSPTGVIPDTDRGRVVRLWETGGPGVRAAAEVALAGSDEQVRHFLAQASDIGVQDQRIQAARIASIGGHYVQEAAAQAIDGTPEQLKAFLADGWKAPLFQDERVRVAQIIDAGGPLVRKAGDAALSGTQDDIENFLRQGQYDWHQQDERLQVAQIIDAGGPNVQKAGDIALSSGSADDIHEFLMVGRYVARSHDQEHATIAQLADQARKAGALAKAQTTAAKDASARAVKAAALAKAAAQKAAAETQAAKGDAQTAAADAARAADAADQAATAAQTAIDAAAAANAAARVAANAAAQAASAAAGAAEAASRARDAAADAASNATQAATARKAAEDARDAAKGARLAADAADQAGNAASDAAAAAKAAAGAGANADAAADAADQANAYADQAGAHSDEASNAAASAHRHAREAARAASAAEDLANQSASAARDARDAANSAATHADNAAKAADDAAAHAGQAATAAQQSTEHAKAAQDAANAASDAVAKAKKTYDLARKIDAEELTTRTNEGIAKAQDLKAQQDRRTAAQQAALQQTKDLDAQAGRLSEQASQPGADPKAIAPQARKIALGIAETGGPWSSAAAEAALAGTDLEITDYARTGWKQAAEQDDRYRVETLAQESSLNSVRTAAQEALKGNADQIRAFLTTGQYQAGEQDFRVHIAQIISSGGSVVQREGDAALSSGSLDKYREFITTGQYNARIQDERLRAAQLNDSGGPEVQAEARIALEGPADLLHVFISVGQYKAQRQDLLSATHLAQVQQLIAEAAGIAATAQKNAAEAGQAAATARKAAQEAAGYAKQAATSANEAKSYAEQAAKSAKEAEDSAANAAAAAKTARKAAADADQSAQDADDSAIDASISATLAQVSATSSWKSADAARASAIAAGKDHDAAAKAFDDAFRAALKTEEAERQARQQDVKNAEGEKARELYRCGILGCEAADHPARWCQHNPVACEIIAEGPAVDAAGQQLWNTEKSFLGLDQLQNCAHFEAGACVELLANAAFSSKLEILHRSEEMLRAVRWGRKLCGQCFPSGTKVLMADGFTRNIEGIRAGDTVLATDPTTGRTAPRRVIRPIVTDGDKHFDELTLKSGDKGSAKLVATDEHPFWSPATHSWVKTKDLTPGATLLSTHGTVVKVLANRAFDQQARTYNLTVDGLHTYYVLAGGTPVLVHNSDGCLRFVDGEIWDDAFEASGQTVETMATVRTASDTVYLDGFMVFPKGTDGLSRAPVGPDALRDMKYALAKQAHTEGFKTVVLNYERHIPKADGTIFKRPGSMVLDVEKILAGG